MNRNLSDILIMFYRLCLVWAGVCCVLPGAHCSSSSIRGLCQQPHPEGAQSGLCTCIHTTNQQNTTTPSARKLTLSGSVIAQNIPKMPHKEHWAPQPQPQLKQTHGGLCSSTADGVWVLVLGGGCSLEEEEEGGRRTKPRPATGKNTTVIELVLVVLSPGCGADREWTHSGFLCCD